MSEQSRLLQQVEEIRQRAKVCPDCGAMRAEHPDHRILCANHECQGGQVTAPDTDALCSALVTLAQAVETRVARMAHEGSCLMCRCEQDCNDGDRLMLVELEAIDAALALLRDGMQHGEP